MEEDGDGSGMVVKEEANIKHNSGGGGQKKRAAGRGKGARGKGET